MIAGSATSRYLLALIMALWLPVCLCHPSDDGQVPALAELPGGHDHGHGDPSDSDDHHDGCPGHDQQGTGCDCPQPAASVQKAETTLKAAGASAVIAQQPAGRQFLVLAGRSTACTRPTGVVPRPPSSLLRMHCALTV